MSILPILGMLPMGAALLGGAFVAFCIIVAILATVFWLWMLIDCLMRDFKDKLVWVLVILFLHIIGALIYYFVVKSKDKKAKKK
jgi:hypothetical protein